MNFFNKYYKKTTGVSKNKGAFLDVVDSVKYKIDDFFQDLKNGSTRRNWTLITVSALSLYLVNKSCVDSWVNDLSDSYIEQKNERRVLRDVHLNTAYLNEVESEVFFVKKELNNLYALKDSLSLVVNNLNNDIVYNKKVFDNSSIVRVGFFSKEDFEPKHKLKSKIDNEYENINSLQSNFKKDFVFKNKSIDFIASSYSDVKDILNKEGAWVAIPSLSNLSVLAEKYYGSFSKYNDLADFNNKVNVNLVLRGEPVSLIVDGLLSYDKVNIGKAPLFEQVLNREYINDFVNRVCGDVSINDVVNYNRNLGNNISSDRELILDTDVVYLSADWIN